MNSLNLQIKEFIHPMSEEKNLSIDKKTQTSSPEQNQEKKKSIAGKIWKPVMWILLCLLLLIILIPLLIYLPPVQRFAVDKASEWLSEETGMEISVGSVGLGFPLDLEMGDVLAVENGDTVLYAEALDASVELLPLLKKKVVVEKVQIDNADVNTKELIESLKLEGHIGSVSLNADEIDLAKETGKINHVLLKDTDLSITLADSVPEDTTEKTPSKWKFDLDDVQTENVRLAINLAPQADSTSVLADIKDGHIKGRLDTETNIFDFPEIQLKNSALGYRSGSEMDLNADFENLDLSASLDLDKGSYKLSDILFKKPDISLNSGPDMSLQVKSDSLSLDGDLDVGNGHLHFNDIDMKKADILMEQSPDMSLSVNMDNLQLDGELDTNSSNLQLKKTKLTKPVVSLRNGPEMTLDVDMDSTTFDGNLNLDSSDLQLSDVVLNKSAISLKQGKDMKLDVSVDQAYLNGDLALDKSDYSFKDAVLKDTKMQLQQGKEMKMDVKSKKLTLDSDFDLDRSDFQFRNVKMNQTTMNMATSDGMSVSADVSKGSLSGQLNLNDEKYEFDHVKLSGSKVKYDANKGKASKNFDTSHIAMNNMDADLSKVVYNGDGSMRFDISHLKGAERSGLVLNDAHGNFTMDNKKLNLKNFHVNTPSSSAKVDFTMDNNAFDTPAKGKTPGKFNLAVDGTFGKSDLSKVLADAYPDFDKSWPNKSIKLRTKAKGNLQDLQVDNLEAYMDGVMDVKGKGNVKNLGRDDMALNTTFDAKVKDTSILKGFIPADVQKELSLPPSVDLAGTARYGKDGIFANVQGYLGETAVNLDGKVDMNSEDYDIATNLHNFKLKDLLPNGQHVELTGYVKAKGHGFDPYASTTRCDATVDLKRLRYEDYELTNVKGDVGLHHNNLTADLTIDDPKLVTHFTGSGKLSKEQIDCDLDMSLAHADLAAFGLYDGRMEVSTDGRFKVTSDLDRQFSCTANVDRLKIQLDDDSISTERMDLIAETTDNNTYVDLESGDLSMKIKSPENLTTIVEKYGKTAEMANRFNKEHRLNFNYLKRHLPDVKMDLEMGNDNALAEILRLRGITCGQTDATITTDSVNGLNGNIQIKDFMRDSIFVESATLDLAQDTTHVRFNADLKLPDQQKFNGFNLKADGFAKMDEAQVVLKHYDQKGRMGVDFGLHIDATDSTLVGRVLPDHPTLAYAKFKMNEDNLILLDSLHNVLKADINLVSQDDSCQISVSADSLLNKEIELLINNVDLAKVSKFVPGMSPMSGMMDLKAIYDQSTTDMDISGSSSLRDFNFDGTKIGNLDITYDYEPTDSTLHKIHAGVTHNQSEVMSIDGTYDSGGAGNINADLQLHDFPLSMANPFIPDELFSVDGTLGGQLHVGGNTENFLVNGVITPSGMVANSELYSLNLKFEDKPITVEDSRLTFDSYKIFGEGSEPMTLSGWVDASDLEEMDFNLSLYAKNFNLMDAPRTKRSMVFGKMDGDFLARVHGTPNDLRVRGLVKILPSTDMTYIMTNTPLSIDYRLSDIVTFVDFTQPPPDAEQRVKHVFTGLDMLMSLVVENGAQFHVEFSADKQSYVDFEGEGSLNMTYTPEGTISLLGRYTIDEGKMKYTLPVIPLKTFNITPGSYIEFTGNPGNPTLNFSANEQMTATVSDSGRASRSVKFLTGLDVKGTLEQMELLFTIDAPEDLAVKNELENMSLEERNKLAVAMLCTGMYLSSSNSSGFNANNALNNFLQNEINNIAGKALDSTVNVDMGLEQTTRDDGTTRTDYSFKFSRRFFNNRLNVIVGGKVSTDGSDTQNESGAYIDDVSLEWRLNEGGTRYVRLFHERNYENLFEGEITSNGVSYIIRKKLDKISDLWRKKTNKYE